MEAIKILSVAALITVFTVGPVFAEGGTANQKEQTTCPVMGGTVNKDIYADHEGKRVYFCCKGCLPEFKKDPAKYINKLESEGIKLQEVPREEPETKANPAADSKCTQGSSCGGCGGCGCS